MSGIGALDREIIDADFFNSWQKKFYNIRAYDVTKELLGNDDANQESQKDVTECPAKEKESDDDFDEPLPKVKHRGGRKRAEKKKEVQKKVIKE